MTAQTSSATGLRLLAHHDLGGHGDGMQVLREGPVLYVGHTGTSGMGTSILDVADPEHPVLASQWPAPPHSHTHKVQVAGGLLLVNHEKFPYRGGRPDGHSAGLAVYSLADPFTPRRLAFWESGGRGVHRIVWTGGRYAHMSATPPGFRDRIWVVLDLADPARPAEAARWWWRGQATGEDPDWPAEHRYAAHHALLAGDRAYLGYDDAGLVVLDVAEIARPRRVAHLQWDGGSTHTCLPLPSRRLVVATDEQVRDGPDAPQRAIRVIDVSGDQPRVLAVCPHPAAAFAGLPMRFGAHNLHENRPGSYRSERLVFATYFSAGLRVYDLAEPARPQEVAHWVPEPPPGQPVAQLNDLFVDGDGLIWVTDRVAGGLYLLAPEPGLARLMAQSRASAS
ncbi:MAG: hypothetical protein J2P33_20325 [Actinobacteria bacterium]|nr:hypothetical protein [Actinomycetota bacterium]